jgi:hypothetical protein
VPATRNAFAAIAIGIDSSTSAQRFQATFCVK